jgi:hypothetical protein
MSSGPVRNEFTSWASAGLNGVGVKVSADDVFEVDAPLVSLDEDFRPVNLSQNDIFAQIYEIATGDGLEDVEDGW